MKSNDRFVARALAPGRAANGRFRRCRIALVVLTIFFMGCSERPSGDASHAQYPWSDSLVTRTGDQIVARTFDTLRNSLVRAIGSEGFPGAISFCRQRAGVLTSAYSDSVSIRRTALRYRNPENRPDTLELEILNTWGSQMGEGKVPGGIVVRAGGRVHYFKPIMMQPLCMNCHGVPGVNIQPATLEAIRRHYPDDLAVDFVAGDLRGAWHLIFQQGAP